MRLLIGSRQEYLFPAETPLIAMLRVHPSRNADLERPDTLELSSPTPIDNYVDGFGNVCGRMVAPAGAFTITTSSICHDNGEPDSVKFDARENPVPELPDDTLVYLLGSRYCDTDLLADLTWKVFGNVPPGWARVQAVSDYVHRRVQFDYSTADSTRTASQTLSGGQGVCRDFTHLAIAICRCLNIPARYCTGYLSDIGEPQPYPPGDFAAWMEVYLDQSWWTFDPRNNARRRGRILIARGRDAADVPLVNTFGTHQLTSFRVFADELA